MDDIKLDYVVGDKRYDLRLSKVTGAGDAVWWSVGFVVPVRGYVVYANFHFLFGKWIFEQSKKADFSYEDQQIMLGLIQDAEGMERTAKPI